MSLDRVRAAVLAAAQAEADQSLAAARADAEKVAADGHAQDQHAREQALRDAQLRADRALARELGQIRQEGRMALLAAKTAQMDRVFAKAREQFLAGSDERRVDAAAVWLAGLPADAGGTLRVHPRDVDAFQKRLPVLNRERDPKAQFTGVEPDPDVAAGAWVVGGDFTADCTLDRRLEQLRESVAPALAARLFGERK